MTLSLNIYAHTLMYKYPSMKYLLGYEDVVVFSFVKKHCYIHNEYVDINHNKKG